MVASGHSMIDENKERREGYEACLLEHVYPMMVDLYELREKKEQP